MLSLNEFGIIGFGASILAFLSNFIIFGFDRICTREVTNNPEFAKKYSETIVLGRVIIAVVIFIFYLLFIFMYYQKNVLVLGFLGLGLIFQALSFNFIFRSTEKFKIITLNQIFSSIIIFILYFIFVKTKTDLIKAVIIINIGSLISIVIYYFEYKKIWGKFKLLIDTKLLKYLFKESSPLFFSSIMVAIYYHLDMIMLGLMKPESHVGIYSAAYKVFLLAVVPFQLIVNAFLPKISHKKGFYGNNFIGYFLIMVISGSIIGSTINFLSAPIINIIYGFNYSLASIPLSVLAINIIIVSVNMSFGEPLTVWGMQKKHLSAVSFGAVSNIVLNFLLIPKYSYTGAAFATLLSEIIVFFVLVWITKNTKSII